MPQKYSFFSWPVTANTIISMAFVIQSVTSGMLKKNIMNYLAHAFLSFQQPDILVGNMISDFVKGKSKFTYTPGIQKGIMLHRAIDQFTDASDIG